MYALVDGSIEVFSQPANRQDAFQEWPCRYYHMQHTDVGHKTYPTMLVVKYSSIGMNPRSTDRSLDSLSSIEGKDGNEGSYRTDRSPGQQESDRTGQNSTDGERREVWCSCDNMLYFYDASDLQPVCPPLQVNSSGCLLVTCAHLASGSIPQAFVNAPFNLPNCNILANEGASILPYTHVIAFFLKYPNIFLQKALKCPLCPTFSRCSKTLQIRIQKKVAEQQAKKGNLTVVLENYWVHSCWCPLTGYM